MCNCNNTTNCGGGCLPCNECQETTSCICAVNISSDCVNNVTAEMPCSAIGQGQTLTAVLEQLDAFICTKFDQTVAFFTLLNVGTGAEVYKGTNGVGSKLIRKINKVGNLVTVTQNTDDISISIDETALDTFIEANQKTYSVANLGTGAELYKDSTVVGNNTQFNLRSIISDNLTITDTGTEVRIETPMTASIPALYVNDLYIPTYNDWLVENKLQNSGTAVLGFIFRGKGTIAQPFTNNTVYPLLGGSPTITPNTAIQNALDGDSAYTIPYSYQGIGTRLNPQRFGQHIIVQNNNSFYNHTGDYNYNYIRIHFQCDVVNTTSGYIIDMDNPLYFDTTNGIFEITVDEGKNFQCTDSLGFRNSGNTSSTPPAYDTGRIGIFKGEGTVYFNYSGANILTRYILNGDGNNNDNNLHFTVGCKMRADQQGIILSKNKMAVDFYNRVISGNLNGSGNIALKAIHMNGGQIRFYEKGSIYLGNNITGRTYGITFEPTGLGIGFCSFQLNSAIVTGNSENCFVKLNNEHVDFLAFNSPSGDGFATTLVGTSTITNGLFENLGVTPWQVNFKNNVFSYTGIDQTKVDLTGGNGYSAVNFIGNEVLENLVVFSSKANAMASGRPYNSAFIKRNVFNAVDLVAGIEYKVVTSGSPSLGAVGDFILATGSETGTGTASLETREIVT